MSRSYHQTLKSVFGGKSKQEIDRMLAEGDPDFLAYVEKRKIKKRVKNRRQLLVLAQELGEDIPKQLLEDLE